ncbi:hypothetical protein PoB_004197800 [Plakobranchus ocellatus]|uniref:Uncharacterized protein n=1 Tax=Plakobranchus ocellatus TaxID=259542 RepID=A0AAV4B787_9GAST|nr:hypothetical protein PoB_004197800 [Plakobranchus ocellatus]
MEKTAEQKILERGHTQMEVNSVYATIVRRLRNMDTYLPLGYVNLIKAARINPRLYKVHYLAFDFFKDFDKYPDALKSIKPFKEVNTTDMCALKYNVGGSLAFKLNFSSDDWQTLQFGRKENLPSTEP